MSTATSNQQSADGGPTSAFNHDRAGMYLTFKLADEEYGVEILKVREIIGFMRITAIPQMPPYMKGVLNLRGKVIPVVDLRLKFGMPEAGQTDQTCIIVVDVGTEVGLIVDTVSEVLDIAGDDIDPPPAVGSGARADFILGMGKVDEDVKILVNISQVLSQDELAALNTATAQGDMPRL
jgi:purine-binding chemotaxis protein CheW